MTFEFSFDFFVIRVEAFVMSSITEKASRITSTSPANLKLPVPEASLEAYSNARLRESLNFATKVLDLRNISPRSDRFYSLFRDKITAVLDAETRYESLSRKVEVLTMEQILFKTYYLQPKHFGRASEVRAALLELREMQYLARYGDYVNIGVGRVRIHAGASKLSGWETISGKYRWSDISRRLKTEEEALQRSCGHPTDGPYPTFLAISHACWSMGYDFDFVRWSIHHHAESNLTSPRGLEDLIVRGGPFLLSEALFHDLKDVWCVFSERRSQTHVEHLQAVIQNHIDLWFNSSLGPKTPGLWTATGELYDAYQKARENNAYARVVEEEREEEKSAQKVALPLLERTWSAQMARWEKSQARLILEE